MQKINAAEYVRGLEDPKVRSRLRNPKTREFVEELVEMALDCQFQLDADDVQTEIRDAQKRTTVECIRVVRDSSTGFALDDNFKPKFAEKFIRDHIASELTRML